MAETPDGGEGDDTAAYLDLMRQIRAIYRTLRRSGLMTTGQFTEEWDAVNAAIYAALDASEDRPGDRACRAGRSAKGAGQLTAAGLPVNGREMLISCGAALYNLRCALRALGYTPSVRQLPDPDRPNLLADVHLEPGEPPDDQVLRERAQIRRRRTPTGADSAPTRFPWASWRPCAKTPNGRAPG